MKYEEVSGLVTVIVPVFNVEQYVEKCLKSIMNQSYQKLEIVVVNDGSSDHSEKIIVRLASEDSRIKYIKRENGGLGAARNTGLKNCTGEYVCFIDSDDWVSTDYVEKLITTAREDSSNIVICNMQYVFADGDVKKRTPYIDQNECIDAKEALKREFIGNQYKFHAPNKFCKTRIFTENNIHFPEGKLYEDVFTTYKMILAAESVSLINDKLYFYLQSRIGSIMNTEIKPQRFTDMYEALDQILSNSQIQALGIEQELQGLYVTNVISLVNYIYPLAGIVKYGTIRKYYKYIIEDKYNYLLKNCRGNDTIDSVNKIRIFMIQHCFWIYCGLMKFGKRLSKGK